jgi:hypothetical protein
MYNDTWLSFVSYEYVKFRSEVINLLFLIVH